MNDLRIKKFLYKNNTFFVWIELFDYLNKNPIKIVNNNTKNEKIFSFDRFENCSMIFKCGNLTLNIKKYE